MTDITIAGSIHTIDTHLAGYGLAAILGGDSRIDYTDRRVTVRTPLSEKEVGYRLVKRIWNIAKPENGWGVRGGQFNAKGVPVAVASAGGYASPFPSAALFTLDTAAERYELRDRVIDNSDALDAEVIVALGRPQYWSPKDSPREGATQLMPSAGDGGREQLVYNILGEAVEQGVCEISGSEALSDLRGEETSRLGSLYEWARGPSPLVKTIVALYGIATLPTSITKGVPARTPGCMYSKQVSTNNNARTVLPVFNSPVSLAKIRGVVAHANWLPVERGKGDAMTLRRLPTARTWTKEQGITLSMVFVPVKRDRTKGTYGQFAVGVEHVE